MSEAQGRHREVASEGSVEQNRDLTNRKRIRGIPGRTSGRLITKSISINGAKRRSGGCAPKAIELTPGDLPGVAFAATETAERPSDRGAGVSRRHSRPSRRQG